MTSQLEKKLKAVAKLANTKGSDMNSRMVRQEFSAAADAVFRTTGYLPWELASCLSLTTGNVTKSIRAFETRAAKYFGKSFVPFLDTLITEKNKMAEVERVRKINDAKIAAANKKYGSAVMICSPS
ncbi:MAG: hypothetical protein WC612_03425 [Bdellovibrionales bacterium]|jgi:hypothetical protein